MSTRKLDLSGQIKYRSEIIIIYAVLLFFTVVMIYPLIWMIFNSLKSMQEFFSDQWGFPQVFRIDNYIKAWTTGKLGLYMFNSVIVTLSSVTGLIVIASLAAFAFAKLDFYGKRILFFYLLLGMMFPPQIIIIPLFGIMSRLGWISKYQALIVPYIALGLPFALFLLRAFFISVPKEIMDSARVDGASDIIIFIRIMFPMVLPGIGIVGIFSGVGIWNEFLFSLLFMQKNTMKTMPAGLMAFFGRHKVDYTQLFAGLVIVIIPMIIFLIIFQKSLVKGITAGSLKG